jgi:predicted nucleotidyltransferase
MWSALDDFTALGILLREQTPGSHLYRINRDHHLAAPLAALFQAEARRVGEVRDVVHSTFTDAGQFESVTAAVLYGSNARGEAGPESDLDVLVVTCDGDGVPPVQEALLDAAEVLRQKFGISRSAYVLPLPRTRPTAPPAMTATPAP